MESQHISPDDISPELAASGFPGSRRINVSDFAKLVAWAQSLELSRHASGLRVAAASPMGAELLERLGVADGSILIGLNELDFKGDSSLSPADAAAEIIRSFRCGRLVFAILDEAGSHLRLHRYLVPVLPSRPVVGHPKRQKSD